MSNEAQGRAEAPVCGADGLKDLLQRIAEQIADSDRRQGEALVEMKDRLGTLGDEARSVRSRVPAEFAPAFERIEEGMALLAERIAGVGTARRGQPWAAHQPAAPVVEHQAPAAPAPAPEAAPVQPPAPAPVAASGQAPAPLALRSAAGTDAPQRAERGAAIDPFDFIEHETRSTTGEWEASDADALTRIYESGEAGVPAQPMQTFAPVASMPVMETGIERQWVEDRLSDVAQRLERSIKDARADGAIAALGQRFEQFERRFDDAIQSVASRSDVEGLKLIEANIAELAGHVEQTARQLERLDSIEGQLVAVADRLSDERLAGLMQQASPDFERLASVAVEQATARFAELRPAQAEPDIERLADLAAERAAVQVAGLSGVRGSGDDHRLDDIRGLLEGFISERRHGDEQTASMLDTMQQAMIRVLDRIDAIEVAQSRTVHAVAAPQVQHQPNPQPAHQPPAPRYAVDTELRADPPRASAPLDPALVPRVDRTAAPAEPAPAVRRDPAPLDSEQRLAQPRSKEDFIAAARRAARQAANEAPGAAPAAAGSRAKAEPAPEGEKKRSLFSLGRKSVVASSIVVILAMAGALTLARLQGTETTVSNVAHPAQVSTPATVAASAAVEPPRVINATGSAASNQEPGEPATGVDHAAGATSDAGEMPGSEAADAHEPVEEAPMPAAVPAPEPRRVSASTATLAGVTLQTSSKPSLRELNRLREQQDLATLSNRLGAEAAKATPASLMVEQTLGAQPASTSAMQPAAQPAASVQPADIAPDLYAAPAEPAPQRATALPPASVGPSSLRVAAAKGDPSAEFEVGARLAEGKGTDQSFAEAMHWYQRSAQKGFAQAQYRLGTFYERGLGAKTDLARAAVWYKRAAEQGNVKAMHNLAVLSASRKAGAPDYATAAKWFSDAADRGLADSQFNLAVLYESGLGVPKDLRQAYKWLTIAARAGDAETVKRRERMRNELSRSDLEAADAMIRDWQPQAADPLANDPRVAGEAWKSRVGMAGSNG